MSQVFDWCREASPSQPLTTPVWHSASYNHMQSLTELERMQITKSDVVSFHHYGDLDALKKVTQSLQQYGIHPYYYYFSIYKCLHCILFAFNV